MKGNVFKLAGSRIKKHSTGKTAQTMGWVLLGGIISRLLPTAIQGLSQNKIDMSGWKGTFVSFFGTSLIGFAFDKPEIAYGAATVETAKLLYVYGNDTIAATLGTPIVAFDKQAVMLPQPAAAVNDDPPGTRTVSGPDGREMLIQAGPNTGVADYTDQLPVQMADYADQLPVQVGDYIDSVDGRNYGGSVVGSHRQAQMADYADALPAHVSDAGYAEEGNMDDFLLNLGQN